MKEQNFTVTDVLFGHYLYRDQGYSIKKINRSSNGITLLLSGEFEIMFDGITQTVHSGDMILQRQGDTYSLFARSTSVEFIVVSYPAEPQDVLSSLLPSRVLHGDHSIRYRSALEAICRIHESRGICYEPLLCSLVQEILCNVIRENDAEARSNEQNPVKHAKRYIEEFYGNDLSVEHIAKVVGVSPSYLRTLFRKSEQESPIHYLNRVRIDRAKEMLASRMFTLNEVAAACGFQNVYYFSRVFKSITGISPGKF
jgi:AraC-like DNA-binding protein